MLELVCVSPFHMNRREGFLKMKIVRPAMCLSLLSARNQNRKRALKQRRFRCEHFGSFINVTNYRSCDLLLSFFCLFDYSSINFLSLHMCILASLLEFSHLLSGKG